MPSVWLPDMEPEASNTIMASSVQGACFFSSVEDAEELQIVSAAEAMAAQTNVEVGGKSAALRAINIGLRMLYTPMSRTNGQEPGWAAHQP
jgi:hypothetical protein